jgi:hypothetical protein
MFGFRRKEPKPRKSHPIIGLLSLGVFCAAASGLAWNESRTVKQAAAIAELNKNHIRVDATRIDPAHENRPIYLFGRGQTEAGSLDDFFQIGGSDALMVRRKVEMYQWEKYRRNDKTRYRLTWDDSYNNLSGSHENPPFEIESARYTAPDAHIGAFQIGDDVLSELDLREFQVPEQLGPESTAQGWRIEAGLAYKGDGSPAEPELGDHRVSFSVINETELSLLARQQGNTVAPFIAKNGYDLMLISTGQHRPERLIADARSANTTLSYALRAAGIGGMALGLGIAFSALFSWLSWIPVLGPAINKFAFWTGALIGGTLGVLLFIGAWLWTHPIWLFAVLAGVSALTIWWGMRRRSAPALAAAMPPSFAAPHQPPPMPTASPHLGPHQGPPPGPPPQP